jgi:hypothetical protein
LSHCHRQERSVGEARKGGETGHSTPTREVLESERSVLNGTEG